MGVKHSWYEIYLKYTERYLDITLNILGVDEEAEEGESKEWHFFPNLFFFLLKFSHIFPPGGALP